MRDSDVAMCLFNPNTGKEEEPGGEQGAAEGGCDHMTPGFMLNISHMEVEED